MSVLTIETFLPHLAPYAGKELLLPKEASLLLLKIVELVLDFPVDVPLLKFLSRFWTPESYDESVEERNIEHQCGYPLCQQTPQHKVRRPSTTNGGVESATKYQIYNRKPLIILPNTYLLQYCCKQHYQASIFYRNQLSHEALFSRKDVLSVPPFPSVTHAWYENNITCLEEVLQKHRELKDEGKTLGEVIAMMNGLSVDDDHDTSELVKLIEDFEIVEHEGGLGADNDSDDPGPLAIEGYVTTSRSFGGYAV